MASVNEGTRLTTRVGRARNGTGSPRSSVNIDLLGQHIAVAGLPRTPAAERPPGQLAGADPPQQPGLGGQPLPVLLDHAGPVGAGHAEERVREVRLRPGVPGPGMPDIAEPARLFQPGHEVLVRTGLA